MSNISFPCKIDFDFAIDYNEALEFCKDYKVVDSEKEGPGGGNPNITIEFKDDIELRKFCTLYSDGDQGMFDEIYECQTERLVKYIQK